MTESKTKATDASVGQYLASIEDASRRADCETLAKLLAKATKQPAKMWGASIVGYGSYQYAYESGRTGESCLVGFSSRKGDISVYGLGTAASRSGGLLPKLGKHKLVKGCLYIRRLEDIDLRVLEELIVGAVKERRPNGPSGA